MRIGSIKFLLKEDDVKSTISTIETLYERSLIFEYGEGESTQVIEPKGLRIDLQPPIVVPLGFAFPVGLRFKSNNNQQIIGELSISRRGHMNLGKPSTFGTFAGPLFTSCGYPCVLSWYLKARSLWLKEWWLGGSRAMGRI
jgi:hypothetical protein